MLKCLATKPPTVVMGPGVRRDDTEGVARDEFNFQTAKENDAPSHPLSTSSLRTPGPIRRAVAVERRCCDISPPNHRRWLWVPAFAGTTPRGLRAMNSTFKQPKRTIRLRTLPLHVVPANAGTHTPCRRSRQTLLP